MSDLRTPEVDNLAFALAKLDDPDIIFALLEDMCSKCLSYGSGGYAAALAILEEKNA